MNSIIPINIISITIFSFMFAECESYDYGDMNDDNFIDIMDIILVVEVIINIDDYNQTADLNLDNINYVIDVVILIQRILDPFEMDIVLEHIEFNFTDLTVRWSKTEDSKFNVYNVYYSNLLIMKRLYYIHQQT